MMHVTLMCAEQPNAKLKGNKTLISHIALKMSNE